MTPLEAMKQALEALEARCGTNADERKELIPNLHAAIEEMEQAKPVAKRLENEAVESQAREARLQEALEMLMSAPFDYPDDEYQQDELANALSYANTLLNQPQDDSALRETLHQEWKKGLRDAVRYLDEQGEDFLRVMSK